MNNKVVTLCYVCSKPATETVEGKGFCKSDLDICRHNRLAAKAQGKNVSLVGEAAKLMRERAGGVTLLKIPDIRKDLIDRLKSEANEKGMTLRELIQSLFEAHLKANEVKR